MRINEIESAIEAILFAVGDEVSAAKLAFCIGIDEKTVRSVIKNMADRYDQEKRGIQILEINDSYQLCVNSDYFEFISKIVKAPQKKVLTQSLIETLAIIAYKQPITKGQIEDIRGVSADHGVNKLVELGLVCEVGRMDVPGRPILFGTTNEFLKYFGFKNLSDLPVLPQYTENDLGEISFDNL